MAYYCFLIVALLWAVAPEKQNPLFLVLPFLFGAYGSMGFVNAQPQYYLDTVPPRLQIVSAIVISLSTGAVAGLLGMVISSQLLKFAAYLNNSGEALMTYRIYFIMISVLIPVIGILVHQLKPVRKHRSV